MGGIMRFHRYLVVFFAILIAVSISTLSSGRSKKTEKQPADTGTAGAAKTIAIGDVDAGYNMNGEKAYDVKETIQLELKKELEKLGNGMYSVIITSPAVVAEEKENEVKAPPAPKNGILSAKEMAKYMAVLQKQQQALSGQVKVHKPVSADSYFDFRVESGSGGGDTGGVASTIGRFTGLDTSMANMSAQSTKIHLVCTMRDPASGQMIDRYIAKASSVKFTDIGGYRSYNYGGNFETRQKLFSKAVRDCAKWMIGKVR